LYRPCRKGQNEILSFTSFLNDQPAHPLSPIIGAEVYQAVPQATKNSDEWTFLTGKSRRFTLLSFDIASPIVWVPDMDRSNARHPFLIVLILLAGVVAYAGAAQDTPQSAIAKAREDLRISQVTCDRISAELERLQSSGEATPELIKDYEDYLRRVQGIRDENKKIVEHMEAAMTRSTKNQASPPLEALKPEITIPEEQGGDRLAALDRELNDSLAAFDEMLLKEMERIRTASANRMKGLAREAAEAARRIEEDIEGSSSGRKSGQDEETDKPGRSQAEDRSDQGDQEGSTGRSEGGFESGGKAKEGDSGPVSKTGERESEQDDDIVARQLREAAEKETDPELKEKLWKEYEAYKASRRKAQERAN